MAKVVGKFVLGRGEGARDKWIIRNNATTATWYDAFIENLTPARLKTILHEADYAGEVGLLYQIYEKMEYTDTRIGGLTDQLRNSVGGLKLKVEPAEVSAESELSLAQDYADVGYEAIANLEDPESITRSFCDPHFYGAKLYQMKWEMSQFPYNRKLWLPTEVKAVDSSLLRMDRDQEERHGEMRVITKRGDGVGTYIKDLPRTSYIFIEDGHVENRYDKAGIMRKILPWYLGLIFVQTWWIQYVENYGAPYRIGRYPRGIDPDVRLNMESFLQMLGNNGYALFPNDMELQLIEANRQGTITTYGDFINKAHEEITVAILGQGDTVGTKKEGSFARDVVSKSIRHEVIQHVGGGIVTKGYRQLMKNVLLANYGPNYNKRLIPKVSPVIISPSEMTTKMTVAKSAQELGVAVREEYFYDQILGTEPPKEGQRAIKYGTTYVFGVDPEPESPAERVERQHKENIKAQEKQEKKNEKQNEKREPMNENNVGRESKSDPKETNK